MYDAQLSRRLREAVVAAGAKDVVRVFASVQMAVADGEDIDAMLSSLKRHQPDLFGRPKRTFTDAPKPSRESQARKSKTTKRARWDDDE